VNRIALSTPTHSFHVARWQVTYRATSLAAASEVCSRLDKMIPAELAEACAASLTQAAADSDPSVWLIRRLDLGLALPAQPACAAESARQWGEHLAATIRKTISRGEENDSLIHFPSRPAYVAQFVRDLAAGRAQGKWYYEDFSSLFALSVSRAIREAIAAQAHAPGDVMWQLLSSRALRDVLLLLTDADARAIVDAWRDASPRPADSQESLWTGRLLEIWNETPLRGSADHPFRDALWWAALAYSRHADANGATLSAIASLLDLRAVLSAFDVKARESLIRDLARGDFNAALAAAMNRPVHDAAGAIAFFERNMKGDVDWARHAQGVLLGESEYARRPQARPIPRGPSIPSRFAGIFRLGPSFVASGLEDALTAFPPRNAAAFRHLVAVKCLGRDRAWQSISDAAVRLFSGFQESNFAGSPHPPCDAGGSFEPEPFFSIDAAASGIAPACDLAASFWTRSVVRHFARRLIGFEASSPQHLYRNFLSGEGSVRDTGEQILVELSAPALSVVLSIAGMLEESYQSPWIEGREICLLRSRE
jgi:hypothetical protein